MHRRLAAILCADVAGYSRMMGADEAGTHAAFKAHRSQTDWTGGQPLSWPPGPTPEQQLACLRGLAADVMAELARAPVDVALIDYMQPEALSAVTEACFRETTTIGLRTQLVHGLVLPRRQTDIALGERNLRVKLVEHRLGNVLDL